MKRLLHTRQKIFFPNPYVLRVEYVNDWPAAKSTHRKIASHAYKVIRSTWGYCNLGYESSRINVNPTVGVGINGNQIIHSIFDYDTTIVPVAYFCFEDYADVIQFMLSVDARAKQVQIWPDNLFTIHEVQYNNES
jgi:hypothetical protein